MRDPNVVLAEKLKEYTVLVQDINALRRVIPMLQESEEAPKPPVEPEEAIL
jgi:hypothetical protein